MQLQDSLFGIFPPCFVHYMVSLYLGKQNFRLCCLFKKGWTQVDKHMHTYTKMTNEANVAALFNCLRATSFLALEIR